MLVDYHTHHYRCGHARGRLDDYVEEAIRRGLREIGLSDHSPIYHFGEDPHPFPETAMSRHELPRYVRDMERVRDRYTGRIRVKLGVESDYVLGWDDHYRELWAGYPLDYVIGSVHWLGRWNIFWTSRPAGRDPEDVYREYLITTQRAALSGAYDVIGHLDCLKTSGHLPTRAITPLLDETLRVLARAGVAIELNTSGWRKTCAECYPRVEILERCRAYGVPVTVGSDAHDPHLVGAGLDQAHRLLREVGYREIATFTRRQRTMVPLEAG